MSQYSNNKGKDTGKKYASFNINPSFQRSKGDGKTGQGNRGHGMQSLGKVQSRRVLKPVNLASLKSENLGNDPLVNLVPTGSQGWGKKETTQTSNQERSTSGSNQPPHGAKTDSSEKQEKQEVVLRPNAGVEPGKTSDQMPKKWGSKANSQSSDSPYFQREFPTLGQEGNKREASGEGDQNVNPQGMAPQQSDGSKPGENATNMPNHPNFNGNQFPYPYAFMPGPGGARMPIHPYYFPYPGSGGKMPPFDPNFMQRMPPPFNQNKGKMERPSTIKDTDLRNLDKEKDENGWAAAQDEVDYNAKLVFDESDESDDDRSSGKKNDRGKERTPNQKRREASEKKEHPGWPAGYPQFHPQMMNWRMPMPPSGAGPQGAPQGYPFPPFFYMPPGMYPPNMQQMQQQPPMPQEDKSKPESKQDPNAAREDQRKQEKTKPSPFDDETGSTENKSRTTDDKARPKKDLYQPQYKEDKPKSALDSGLKSDSKFRSRNNSEASDSSRRSFRGSQSDIKDRNEENNKADNSKMRVMRRKESLDSSSSEVHASDKEPEKQTAVRTAWDEDDPKEQENKTVRRGIHPKGGLKDLSVTRKDEQRSQGRHETESNAPSGQRYKEMRLPRNNDPSKTKSRTDRPSDTTQGPPANNKPSPWANVVSGDKKKVTTGDNQMKSLVEIQKEEEKRQKDDATNIKTEEPRQSPDENKFRSDNVDRYQGNKPRPQGRQNYDQRNDRRPFDRERPDRGGERPDRGGDRNFDRKSRLSGRTERGYEQRDNRQDNDRRGEYRERRDDDKRPPRDRRDRNQYDKDRPFDKDRVDKYNDRRDKRDFNNRDREDRRDNYRDIRKDNRDNNRRDYRNEKRDKNEEVKYRGDENEKRDTEKGSKQSLTDKTEVTPKEDRKDDRPTESRDDKNIANRSDRQLGQRDSNRSDKSYDDRKQDYRKREDRNDYRNDSRNRDDRKDTRPRDRQNRGESRNYEERNDWRKDRPPREKEDRSDTRGKDRGDDRKDYRKDSRTRDRGERNESRTRDDRNDYRNDPRNKDGGNKRWEKKEKPFQKTSSTDDVKSATVENKEGSKSEETTLQTVQPIKADDQPSAKPTVEESKDGEKSQDTTISSSSKEVEKESTAKPHQNERSERRYDDREDSMGHREFNKRGRGRGRGGSGGMDRYSRNSYRDKSSNKYNKGEQGDAEGEVDEENRRGKRFEARSTTNWEEPPPRFRGRGRGGKPEGVPRGRGRGGRGGREFNQRVGRDRNEETEDGEKFKSSEENRPSFEDKSELDGESKSVSTDRKQRLSSSSAPREKRGSLAAKTGRVGRGAGRGATRSVRGGKTPFLANRQQVGDPGKQRKSREENASSAADKNTSNNKSLSTQKDENNTDDVMMHSPPKKVKSQEKREEKKRDISREFDLNNIRSVVVIDDIPNTQQDQSAKNSISEDDGFTMVTSKKQLREQRDRAREEEKKKQKTEQKKEQQAAKDAAKNKERQQTAANRKEGQAKENKPPVTTTPTTKPSSETSSQATTPVTSVSTSVTSKASTTTVSSGSNAAMAAIGGWEPAQSLMRTSQPPATITPSEATKLPISNVNAWQRPLTLNAVASVPDPRAVGTGKPSSSQTSVKGSLVPSHPIPESASPLVTPPTLTPISTISSSAMEPISEKLPPSSTSTKTLPTSETVKASVASTKTDTSVTTVATDKPSTAKPKSKKETSEQANRSQQGSKDSDVKKDKRDPKKRENRTEKPPRFQSQNDKNRRDGSNRREDGKSRYDDNKGRYEDGKGRYDDGKGRYDNRNKRYERDGKRGERSERDNRDRVDRDREDPRSRKRTADRQRKNDSKTSNDSEKPKTSKANGTIDKAPNVNRKPPPAVSASHKKAIVNDDVFVATEVAQLESAKSILSAADKVVGSNKPSLKSQSSIGSFTTGEDPDIKIESADFKDEDERNANQTARSVIKSLSDDEERSLETRSLPGSPPLVVKIPEPIVSGPSSDPGRAPSPNKTQAPTMDQEMNEMNRRLFNTRRVWETSPWSEAKESTSNTQAIVSSIGVVDTGSSETTADTSASLLESDPVVSVKAPESAPSTDSVNKTDEKPSLSGFSNMTKRPEQQICKVKPQQQAQQPNAQPHEATRLNQPKSEGERTINTNTQNPLSKLSYMLPVNNRENALYATSENNYSESFRSATNQFTTLGSSGPSLPHNQLSSLQVGNAGNLYGTGMTWQMMSGSTIQTQQTQKSVPYPSQNHGSLFTSPVSLSSNPMIMSYDSNFDHQRTSSSMQRQPIPILPLQQQQQTQHPNASNSIMGVIPTTVHATGRPLRRDQLYRNSDALNNPNITLLLNQATSLPQHLAIAAQQQAQQNTDLTKHVNAKPFQPTTQTPPLMQSPPIMQQSVPIPQHQIHAAMFRPQSSTQRVAPPRQHHLQNLPGQSLLQNQQRQNIVQMQQQANPLVAPVRPRPLQQSMNPSKPSVDRSINMNYLKGSTPHSVNVNNARRQPQMNHVQLSNQALPNHFVASSIIHQHQQPQHHVHRSVGPIQRPSSNQHIPNFPSTAIAQQVQHPSQQQPIVTNETIDFKKIQRQKMLEDTKKYFQKEQQHGPTSSPSIEKMEENLSPDKMVADQQRDKKFASTKMNSSAPASSFPKNIMHDRNGGSATRQSPSLDESKKNGAATSPAIQENRRSVPSNV